MQKIMNGEAIHKFVRVQLVGGAKVALSWVRLHYPMIDLDKVSRSLLAPPDGGPHYAAPQEPAKRIICHLLDQDRDFFINFGI